MKILLEELPHQEQSIEAILNNFTGVEEHSAVTKNSNVYANPLIRNPYNESSNIDVKMETGTGKTYVYTRLMYELHKKYGIFKFVIVVPTPAIKEGTKNFIQSDYAKQHFSHFNTRIELNVINAGDFKAKSGRKNFPAQLLNYVEGSRQNSNTIQVLLINAGMLNSSNMKKNDYDQTLIGGVTNPLKAIQNTNPVVIIDEPHRFPRNKANYQAIESIKPQIVLRFGATFPDVTVGKGKNKIIKKDYYRGKPQFDLNAVESFNNGLVKGIDIYYPNLTEEQAKNRYVVEGISARELVLKQNDKSWTLGVGDKLAEVDSGFEGDVEYVGSKMLSNELELEKGMCLIPGTYRSSYQELIIKDAIDKHFEIEQANFLRSNQREYNAPRIKTLSLFFIDNINSYRQKDGWLKETFERLLKEKLSRLVLEYEFKRLPREKEYLEFLRATQASLSVEDDKQNVHAGYFGEDRGSGDEAIQLEVDDILKNKEKLLSFKDENGNWQTRRFLFSKWTLREGWDNPNVFVIAKLRTSGSENSKIQEVGRGLRLPVDETGRRIQQVEWPSRLAFLIGYDEKDFAQKLVGEINSDVKFELNEQKLTDEMIQLIVTERQKADPNFTDETLLENLDELNVINRRNEFKKEIEIDGIKKDGFEWFVELYPEINNYRLREGKVRNAANSKTKVRVKLKKENWEKVKELWRHISNRYMVEFKRIPKQIQMVAHEVIGNPSLYEREVPMQMKESVYASEDNKKVIVKEKETDYERVYLPGMAYGKFVKSINKATGIPIKDIHMNLFKLLKFDLNGDSRYLSEISLQNISREFKKRFDEIFSQTYEYKKLDFQARTSIYNPETDSFVEEINAEVIGVNIDQNAHEDKRYLYENPPMRYDSVTPERELLRHGYDRKVTVFGKLPKRAIQVPKYTGGSTTPDFIYMIEKEDNTSVYLLVETKAENMRIDDQRIIDIQKKFFESIETNRIEFEEATSASQVYSTIRRLAEEREENNE